nr:unnamed protein product [Callosobruchus chinensis]
MSGSESSKPPEEKVVFKRKKQSKPLRQRIKTDDSDDENIEQVSSKLTEMRELQKLRERPNGVSIVGLALGTNISSEEDSIVVSHSKQDISILYR